LLHSRHIILILSQQVFARTLTCCFTQDTLYWFWVNKSLLVPLHVASLKTHYTDFESTSLCSYPSMLPEMQHIHFYCILFYLTRDWNHDLLHSSEHADFTLPGIETMIYCTRVSTLILPYQGLKPWSTAPEWARWFYLTRDWNHDLLHPSEHADFTLPGIETMIYCTRVSTLTSPMWFQISHTIKYCLIFGNDFQDYLDNWISHF
jgi:hypothetical protein